MSSLLAKFTKKRKRSKPYFRSERQFMGKMRRAGIKLLPYPQKFFVVDYGQPSSYTPDFLEVGTNRYYEVTASSQCFERNKSKYESFRMINPNLELINVKPNGEPYVHKPRRKKPYAYKEKSYYNKKRDEVIEL